LVVGVRNEFAGVVAVELEKRPPPVLGVVEPPLKENGVDVEGEEVFDAPKLNKPEPVPPLVDPNAGVAEPNVEVLGEEEPKEVEPADEPKAVDPVVLELPNKLVPFVAVPPKAEEPNVELGEEVVEPKEEPNVELGAAVVEPKAGDVVEPNAGVELVEPKAGVADAPKAELPVVDELPPNENAEDPVAGVEPNVEVEGVLEPKSEDPVAGVEPNAEVEEPPNAEDELPPPKRLDPPVFVEEPKGLLVAGVEPKAEVVELGVEPKADPPPNAEPVVPEPKAEV